MKSSPILFSAPMVRALRENRKTQTRRTRGLDKINAEPDAWELLYSGGIDNAWWTFARRDNPEVVEKLRCPYGVAGDRLWVRESFDLASDFAGNQIMATEPEMGAILNMHPEAPEGSERWCLKWKLKPSIYMPRWASRDTLEVVSARPERLQHITAADAVAEGCESCTPYDQFRALWHSINGKKLPWSKNPWVWVISFKRLSIG